MNYLSRFSLEGKAALITGASRGIGRSAALAFAQAGAAVALTSRKQEDLEKVAGEIRAAAKLLMSHPPAPLSLNIKTVRLPWPKRR